MKCCGDDRSVKKKKARISKGCAAEGSEVLRRYFPMSVTRLYESLTSMKRCGDRFVAKRQPGTKLSSDWLAATVLLTLQHLT